VSDRPTPANAGLFEKLGRYLDGRSNADVEVGFEGGRYVVRLTPSA
jgi:hypothetical protein